VDGAFYLAGDQMCAPPWRQWTNARLGASAACLAAVAAASGGCSDASMCFGSFRRFRLLSYHADAMDAHAGVVRDCVTGAIAIQALPHSIRARAHAHAPHTRTTGRLRYANDCAWAYSHSVAPYCLLHQAKCSQTGDASTAAPRRARAASLTVRNPSGCVRTGCAPSCRQSLVCFSPCAPATAAPRRCWRSRARSAALCTPLRRCPARANT
jgi:hypothetical protein